MYGVLTWSLYNLTYNSFKKFKFEYLYFSRTCYVIPFITYLLWKIFLLFSFDFGFVSMCYTNVCIGYKCANAIQCLITFMVCTLCRLWNIVHKYQDVIYMVAWLYGWKVNPLYTWGKLRLSIILTCPSIVNLNNKHSKRPNGGRTYAIYSEHYGKLGVLLITFSML